MDSVMIFPEPGELKTIAKQLLALADKPTDVEYIMWPEQGFRVPEELASRFVVARKGESSQVETLEVEAAEVVEPVKRKPGRPKKEAQ